MAHYVRYTISSGAFTSSGSTSIAPSPGQAEKFFAQDPVGGATTGQDEITVVINSPVTQTLTIVVGGCVVEYGE